MWRRRHAPDLIAEVRPVGGMGLWDVFVYREGIPELTPGGRFGLLTDAHHPGDALAAIVFDHACERSCGVWEAIEGPPRATSRG